MIIRKVQKGNISSSVDIARLDFIPGGFGKSRLIGHDRIMAPTNNKKMGVLMADMIDDRFQLNNDIKEKIRQEILEEEKREQSKAFASLNRNFRKPFSKIERKKPFGNYKSSFL